MPIVFISVPNICVHLSHEGDYKHKSQTQGFKDQLAANFFGDKPKAKQKEKEIGIKLNVDYNNKDYNRGKTVADVAAFAVPGALEGKVSKALLKGTGKLVSKTVGKAVKNGAEKAIKTTTIKGAKKLTAKDGVKLANKIKADAAVREFKETGKIAGKSIKNKTLKQEGKKFAANRVADVALSTPMNMASASATSDNSKDFAKQFGLNTAMDIGLGSAVDALGVRKVLKNAGKSISEARKLKIKNKKTGEVVYEGTVKNSEGAKIVLANSAQKAGGMKNIEVQGEPVKTSQNFTKSTENAKNMSQTSQKGAKIEEKVQKTPIKGQEKAEKLQGNPNKLQETPTKVQSEQEYLAERGVGSDFTDHSIDKTHGRVSGRVHENKLKDFDKVSDEYYQKKEAVREEYRAKVENGEIRKPSEIEQAIKTASGHSDNPSVISARKMLEKRGIDWKTGEPISGYKEKVQSQVESGEITAEAGAKRIASHDEYKNSVQSVSEATPLNVGKATSIKNPYKGDVPTQKFSGKSTDIDTKNVDKASQTIKTAQKKSTIKKFYENVFENGGGSRSVPVESMEFKGKPYNVFVGKKVIGKVVSAPNMSPEKLAVIENIDDVITTSKYMGSGEYVAKTSKQKDVVRYDYFESDVKTGNKEYTVSFDVEVYPNTNNYRTHQITKIDLTQKSSADVGPVPTAKDNVSSLIDDSISGSSKNVNTAWKQAGKEHGTYKNSTPKSVDGETKVSKGIDNAMSAKGVVQDEAVQNKIKTDTLLGDLNWERKSQKDALASAQKRVEKNPEQVQKNFNGTVTATDNDIANGVALYEYHIKNGDVEAASEAIEKVSLQLSEAGRTVSAANMLMKATPMGRVRTIRNVADKLTQKYARRLKGESVELSDETIERISNAKTEKEIAEANKAAQIEMWEQLPVTWLEKADAWRYLAMLGNPKTHIRNIVGNFLFAVVRKFKDTIAANGEYIAETFGVLKKGERTKAVLRRADDREIMEFGRKDYDSMETSIRSGSQRWGDSMRPEGSKIFTSKLATPIEKLRRFNAWLLDQEDLAFMRPAYGNAMARYMKANGLKPADMVGETLQKARNIATDEALQSTYRDVSNFSNWLSKLKNFDETSSSGKKVAGVIVNSMIPFTKTPINILRRGIDYSPIGLVRETVKLSKAIRRGDGDAIVKAIDGVSAGLTGTGIVGLGALFNKMGILTGAGTTDAEGKYTEDLGEQGYAIKLPGGGTYTIDWAVPAALPLFMGVEANEACGGDDSDLMSVVDIAGKIVNPAMELSMMQGVTNIAKTFRSADSGGAIASEMTLGVATNYVGQFVPTVLGQGSRTVDDTQRTTTSTAKSATSRTLEKFWLKQKNKIPFLSKTSEPYLDKWGREVKSGLGERIFENFFSPGYYSKNKTTAVDEELLNLSQRVDEGSSVLPKGLDGYDLKFGGENVRLSKKALTTYNRIKGEQAYRTAKSLIETEDYQMMSDTEKKAAIQKLFKNSGDWAKQETLISMGKDKFAVRTEDWNDTNTSKAQDYVDKKHDIDDIVGINKKMSAANLPTTRDANPIIHAFLLNKDNANKDLYKYFSVGKEQREKAASYEKDGGSVKELKDAQSYIKMIASARGKKAGKLPKPLRALGIAQAGGSDRLATLYDDSTPKSRDYYKQTIEAGKGMALNNITVQDIAKIRKKANSNGNRKVSTAEAVAYLDGTKYNKDQKSAIFRAIGPWNAGNPYGEYVAPKNAKTKTSKKDIVATQKGMPTERKINSAWLKDTVGYNKKVEDVKEATKKGNPKLTTQTLATGGTNDIIKAVDRLIGVKRDKNNMVIKDKDGDPIKTPSKLTEAYMKAYKKANGGSESTSGGSGSESGKGKKGRSGRGGSGGGSGSTASGDTSVSAATTKLPETVAALKRSGMSTAEIIKLFKKLTAENNVGGSRYAKSGVSTRFSR